MEVMIWDTEAWLGGHRNHQKQERNAGSVSILISSCSGCQGAPERLRQLTDWLPKAQEKMRKDEKSDVRGENDWRRYNVATQDEAIPA